MLKLELLIFLIPYKMIPKKILYLSLSVVVFIATLFTILMSDISIGIIDNTLSIQWIVLFTFSLVLPLLNVAEIIINKDDWNEYYWLGLLFNIVTIAFEMRFFKIGLF